MRSPWLRVAILGVVLTTPGLGRSVPIGAPLLEAAAAVKTAGPKLAGLWPGYWPLDQAFIFYGPAEGALLISPLGARPAEFQPLAPAAVPKGLEGAAFHRPGELPGFAAAFRLNFPLSPGRTAILVRSTAEGPRNTAELAFHEQFHEFQFKAFRRTGRSQFIDPAAIADRTAFSAGAEVERRVLRAALSARYKAERETLVRSYLALRRERGAGLPVAVAKVEDDFDVLEGTARYVQRQASAATFGGGDREVREALRDELGEDLAAKPGPYLSTWFRGRSYAVGAALCYLLDRGNAPDWRARVQGGARLHEILAETVGYEDGPQMRGLAQEARRRFGYEQSLRELEPQIRSISRDEITTPSQFYALAPYRVTFAHPPVRVNGRSMISLGFTSTSMSQLTPQSLVLPQPDVVSMTAPAASLTVQGRPFLREASPAGERFTALLPGAPAVAGQGALPLGEHRLPRLHLRGEGYELKVDTPVVVVVSAAETVVTAAP